MQNYSFNKLSCILCLLISSLSLPAKSSRKSTRKKSVIFASWGYNRSWYTHSNIHFTGSDYDFTMNHTIAKDRQSPFSFETYCTPKYLTIPQYNFSIGMVLPNQLRISLGQDHMKYVVQQNTMVEINGYIHNNTEYAGEFVNEQRMITNDFLQFEHTDGLNYVHANISREHSLQPKRYGFLQLKADLGINLGVIIPRSDVTLMHYQRNNTFHLAGYGFGLSTGLQADFFKVVFIRLDHKAGFINMPNILSRGIAYHDRAKQHFGFTECYFSLGLKYAW